jgi:hypothetical protein
MALTQQDQVDVVQQIRQAAQTGGLIDLRTHVREQDDPAHGRTWAAARTVGAQLLVELLTTKPHNGRPQAVKLRGARITGPLNLEAATLVCPLLLQDCLLEEPVNLQEAQAAAIRLPGCHLPRLTADRLHTRGNLELTDGFTVHGQVSLVGAHIGGILRCHGGRFNNPNGYAINATNLTVDLSMICRAEFAAQGEVRLDGAHIGGQLNCNGGLFNNLGGRALTGDGLTVGHSMFCGDGFAAHGEVRLFGAHIGGQLDCDGGHFTNPGQPALTGNGLTVGQDMRCREGFTAEGEVSLLGAHIGGQLDCDGGHFTNPSGPALIGDGLTVDQDMRCQTGFVAQGEVRLWFAHIGGALNCAGGSLTNLDGRALTGDGLTVDQDMFCRDGFTAQGEVSLAYAHIGGVLDCSGGHFTNPSGPALSGDRLTVDQDVSFGDGFTADGEVSLAYSRIGATLSFNGQFTNRKGPALTGARLTVDQEMSFGDGFTAQGEVNLFAAHIGGRWSCQGASFTNSGGVALNLEEVSAAVLLLQPQDPPNGVVDLTNARVGRFIDDPASWPATLRLAGFVYETVENDQVTVRDRLGWVRRYQERYIPQSYEQLAAVYRQAGDEQAARRVKIAGQQHRRQVLTQLGKAWNWLLYLTVGYGYRTWLAGLWLLGFLLAGTATFAVARSQQLLTAAKPAWELQHLNPLVYALDVLLPIVNLGQEGGWVPHRWAAVCYWVLTLVGWILTTAVVAGLTGVLKRD